MADAPTRRDEVVALRAEALDEVLKAGACPSAVSRLLELDAELRAIDSKAKPGEAKS